jgi:hypothetical protein
MMQMSVMACFLMLLIVGWLLLLMAAAEKVAVAIFYIF